jgi:hypothetical protein
MFSVTTKKKNYASSSKLVTSLFIFNKHFSCEQQNYIHRLHLSWSRGWFINSQWCRPINSPLESYSCLSSTLSCIRTPVGNSDTITGEFISVRLPALSMTQSCSWSGWSILHCKRYNCTRWSTRCLHFKLVLFVTGHAFRTSVTNVFKLTERAKTKYWQHLQWGIIF